MTKLLFLGILLFCLTSGAVEGKAWSYFRDHVPHSTILCYLYSVGNVVIIKAGVTRAFETSMEVR